MLIVGAGIGGSGAAIVVQRATPTFFDGTVLYDFLRTNAGINDAGSFVFAADTTAPTSMDEIGARWTPEAGFELIAREGTQAPDQPPGVVYVGAGFPHILADNRVAFLSGLRGASADGAFLNTSIDDGQVFLQTGVTAPADQAFPGTPLEFFGTFAIDALGGTYLYGGRLQNGHDIITINNQVVAERNRPLPDGHPGFFTDPDLFDEGGSVSPYNGHFAFRNPADFNGDGIPDGDVVVVDDRVVWATGDPIVPGSTEVWDDTLWGGPFLNVVNSHGDYIIAGYTANGPNPDVPVLVWNSQIVILRPGEPADLDGDGLANDGVYAGIPEAGYLTDNGRFYFTADIDFDAEGFLWMPVPVRGDLNCDESIDFFDIDPFLLALFDAPAYAAAYPDCWTITADVNRDGFVDFFDIDPFVNCLFGGCGVQAP